MIKHDVFNFISRIYINHATEIDTAETPFFNFYVNFDAINAGMIYELSKVNGYYVLHTIEGVEVAQTKILVDFDLKFVKLGLEFFDDTISELFD